MNKYEKIEAECLRDREISEFPIDEYLIYYCAGREPDIDGYAAQYGIDTETARNLVSGLLNRLNNLFN